MNVALTRPDLVLLGKSSGFQGMNHNRRSVGVRRSTTTESVFAYRGVLLMNRKLLASAICAVVFVAASATAHAQDTSAPAQQAQG